MTLESRVWIEISQFAYIMHIIYGKQGWLQQDQRWSGSQYAPDLSRLYWIGLGINVCTSTRLYWCACIYCNTIIPALASLWLPLVAECRSDSKADSKDFALLVNLGQKTHLNTSYNSGFFLAKKPPFAQPMNYLNFGTIAKGNWFNEIEKREVPWLPLCIVCLFVLVFERASRVWVTWLHM